MAVDTRHRALRSDALPEHAPYADTGCHEHPACLTCPFTRCIYEDLHVKQETLKTRNDRMIELYESGVSMADIGLLYGVTRQSVHGVISRRRRKTR